VENGMIDNIKAVFEKFQTQSEFVDAEPYGSGHINDTFAVRCKGKADRFSYILQRINSNIFPEPEKLMDNIVRVTEHIRKKLELQNAEEIDRKVLTVIRSINSLPYYIDEHQRYWRMYIFIQNARTYDVIESLDQAREAAKSFGIFQGMLADLPGAALYEILPGFHDGQKRFAAFEKAVKDDVCGRVKASEREIGFVNEHKWIFDKVSQLIEKGQVPVRITHNDTKINNVMLDDVTGEGVCVIDLDTVMPGLSLYDFGDMVRTSTITAAEDEVDLSKVIMAIDRFEAIVSGYLSTAGKFLCQAEIDNLILGGKMITLIIGVRFLTDFLMGDAYFKTSRENHNLDRCRTQFKLIESIEQQQNEMQALVEKLVK
jgi:thiamine kinase-like enzyme